MNDQDRDLIAALAEGRLDTSAAEEATARVEADPELFSEYTHQLAAIVFLRSDIPPMMTGSERVTLRSNLTKQLGLLPVTTPAPSKEKTQWWVPVFGFAAAAAVVAAFVLFPDSSQDTFTDVSRDFEAGIESTSPSSASSPQTTVASTQAPSLGADTQDSAAEEQSSSEAPQVNDDGTFSVYETDSIELDELLSQAEGADSPQGVQQQLAPMSLKSTVDLSSDEIVACLSSLDAELPEGVQEVLVVGADTDGDQTIVHVGFDFGQGIEDGMSFVLDTCEFVEHSPQG